MQENFSIGMEIGKKNFDNFNKKGKRWHARKTPKWILDNLRTPYFITEPTPGIEHLYILQMPSSKEEKVHFILYSKRERPSAIPGSS